MPRSPVMDLLGLVPRKIKEEELQVGDHICTDRNLTLYYHHGIYIGNDRVIHFTKVSETHPPGEKDVCDHYDDTTKTKSSGVRMCCLNCFVHRSPRFHLHPHSLYIFEYGKHVTPVSAISLAGTHYKSSDPATVVRRATDKLQDDDFGHYCLEINNCETFAFFCKTGKRYWFGSKQVLLAGVFVAVEIAARVFR